MIQDFVVYREDDKVILSYEPESNKDIAQDLILPKKVQAAFDNLLAAEIPEKDVVGYLDKIADNHTSLVIEFSDNDKWMAIGFKKSNMIVLYKKTDKTWELVTVYSYPKEYEGFTINSPLAIGLSNRNIAIATKFKSNESEFINYDVFDLFKLSPISSYIDENRITSTDEPYYNFDIQYNDDNRNILNTGKQTIYIDGTKIEAEFLATIDNLTLEPISFRVIHDVRFKKMLLLEYEFDK